MAGRPINRILSFAYLQWLVNSRPIPRWFRGMHSHSGFITVLRSLELVPHGWLFYRAETRHKLWAILSLLSNLITKEKKGAIYCFLLMPNYLNVIPIATDRERSCLCFYEPKRKKIRHLWNCFLCQTVCLDGQLPLVIERRNQFTDDCSDVRRCPDDRRRDYKPRLTFRIIVSLQW